MVVFAVEYALRLLSAHHHRDHKRSLAPALSFVLSLYSLIDLLTIAPYFWTLAYPGGSVCPAPPRPLLRKTVYLG